MKHPTPAAVLSTLLLVACGGKGGGGGGTPPVRPNAAPVLQLPAGLEGSAPIVSLTLPTADPRTLTFLASDPDGDPLDWQVAVVAGSLTGAGVVVQSPRAGAGFPLELVPVTAPAAVTLELLVQDPFGGAAGVRLTVARSGAPTLSAVSPASAYASQPQTVTLRGSAFLLGGTVTTSVTFGGAPATDVRVLDDTTLTCRTPVTGVTGATTVAVAHRHGSAALAQDQFTLFGWPPRFAPADRQLDGAGADRVQLASGNDILHAVWTGGGTLQHRRSRDGGNTWDPASALGGPSADEAVLRAIGDEVQVAWIENGNAVWIARSTDAGATFGTPERLDAVAAPEVPSRRVRLCGDGARLHAAWLEGAPSAVRVHANSSGDRGATWFGPRPVTGATPNQDALELACAGDQVWVVFTDDRSGPTSRGVFVVRSDDGGGSWQTADRRLNDAGTAGGAPQLCTDAGRVHVVWEGGGSVFYNGSADQGATWRSSHVLVRGPGAGAVSAPRVCCEGSRVYVAYLAGGTAVWLSRSTDAATFPAHQRLDLGDDPSAEVRVACQRDYVHAVWREGDLGLGAARLRFTVSVDAGATFRTEAGLGDGGANQTAPHLLVDGARIALAWLDQRLAQAGAFANVTAP